MPNLASPIGFVARAWLRQASSLAASSKRGSWRFDLPPHRTSLVILAAALPILGCDRGNGDDAKPGNCAAELLPGDVVITELMANPGGADEGSEWLELYNARQENLDLSGVEIVASKTDGTGEKVHLITALELAAGAYAALGDVLDDEALRPAWIQYGYGRDLGALANNGGRLAVYCGTTLVDEVLYQEPSDGNARGYDGARTPDASGNDDLTAWCDGRSSFADGSFGTPGAANDACLEEAPTSCTEDGSTRPLVAPEPGDLVINEYHPNPAAVSDAQGEFFEIYVARDIDLNGIVVGSGDKETVLREERCLRATAGTYLVFARTPDPVANGGLGPDYTFGFSLTNSSGSLFVALGDKLLDDITYASSANGASMNLDPMLRDPTSNDFDDAFCPSTQTYGAGDRGTPGAENESCAGGPVTPGQCMEDGESRAPRPPGPGDLLITEVMPNPAAVTDNDGEWFEVLINGEFDLNGLELGVEDVDQVLESETCLSVTAGQRLVFARQADSTLNGGLPQVDHTLAFSLRNSDGRLFLGHDGETLDAVAWTASGNGASTALDPAVTDPEDNDDVDRWCAATEPYGAGDLGTPGAENASCGGTSVEGTCTDGAQTRAIVAPEVGDLIITEFMPNPAAVNDAQGEWFEVLATADVDLNGLELGSAIGTVGNTLPSGGACLSVSTGDRIVFARRSNPAENGGIEDVFATFSFGLTNGGGDIVVGLAGDLLDAISYTSSSSGIATSLDPGLEDHELNDEAEAYCSATSPYGDGDRGTPGAVNDACE